MDILKKYNIHFRIDWSVFQDLNTAEQIFARHIERTHLKEVPDNWNPERLDWEKIVAFYDGFPKLSDAEIQKFKDKTIEFHCELTQLGISQPVTPENLKSGFSLSFQDYGFDMVMPELSTSYDEPKAVYYLNHALNMLNNLTERAKNAELLCADAPQNNTLSVELNDLKRACYAVALTWHRNAKIMHRLHPENQAFLLQWEDSKKAIDLHYIQLSGGMP